jgi:hypothetical protein
MKYDILIDQRGQDFKQLDNGEYRFFGEELNQGYIQGDIDESNLEEIFNQILFDAKTLNYKIKGIYISDEKTINTITKTL